MSFPGETILQKNSHSLHTTVTVGKCEKAALIPLIALSFHSSLRPYLHDVLGENAKL